MRRLWIGIAMCGLLFAMDLGAAELARPYEAALAVSYGYDNSSGGGCTDYECGSICYSGHGGSDFPLSIGTNVLAGADGTVSAVNNSCNNYGYLGNTCGGRCGNYVQIQHPNGDRTIYCHMKRNSLTVSTGDSVSCGQVIGKSASSGSSTGPHLHLGWRPGGGASTDVYAGSCNSSPGAWRQQNGYGEPPGGSCGCVPETEVCDGTDNNCDGTVDSGDVCAVELLHQAPHAYATPQTTDVDGDGRQNVCARFYAGFRCFGSTGSEWEEAISTTLMAEEDGWGSPKYYSTIRMGDIDGDGKADVCARHSGGFTCWLSTGDDFEEFDTIGWSNDGSWDNPQYYTTIRLADINGNGRDDVCARGASGWRCHLSTPDGFGERIEGPAWSDAAGFDRARYYGTIRVGDIDGDGLDDVCIRKPEGLVCYRSTGDGFELLTDTGFMTDEHGWGNIIYWSTIRLADIHGDGTLGVCARNASSLFCFRFNGTEFDDRIELGGLSNDSGWSDPTNYATLRVGDVTGDGSDDLCIRANAGMRCYRIDGDEVTRWDGPEWSNANGWEARASHGPLFITNIDDQERGALCGRSDAGLTCETYAGGDFETHPLFEQFTDGGGWTARKYYSTIQMGQGVCRADWCDEEEEPEDEEPVDDPIVDDPVVDDPEEPVDPDEPADPISDSGGDDNGGDLGGGVSGGDDEASGSEDDVGGIDDAGQSQEANMQNVSTSSSCASTSSGQPMGLIILVIVGVLGLGWRRRCRRMRRNSPRYFAAFLVVGLVLFIGCDRAPSNVESHLEEEQAEAKMAESTIEESASSTSAASGTEWNDETHDVLAIHGSWRVVGEPVRMPEGTDGPLRYRPLLLDSGVQSQWPMEQAIISGAHIIGDSPTLFALGTDGTLSRVSLDADDGDFGQPTVVDEKISSQVSPSPDGCCVAYIREAPDQTLHVYDLEEGEVSMVELGYSLGWSPAVSAGGEQVAWTASPLGHASMQVFQPGAQEPRSITNAGQRIAPEDLDPFPRGIHVPIWTAEGIAFDGGDKLWLIDDDGEYLGSADAADGMFWDAVRAKLVDQHGEAIVWQDVDEP